MAGGNGEGGGGEAVVELDDAAKLLVEHLVQPVLPRRAHRREQALVPEKQDTVARQVPSQHRKNSNLNKKRKSNAINGSPATSTEHRDGTILPQTLGDTEISSSATENMNDQMFASLQSLKKMWDDIICYMYHLSFQLGEHCMLGDRSAQLDVDIQTILTEGEVTSRVMSIMRRYETNNLNVMQVVSPTNSGEGSQTMNLKRNRLTEAILLRKKCQELDEICRENNWILPRYAVLPSAIDGLYQASVHLVCPDLKMSADGDTKTTPREARNSAAANLLYQLHIKAKEKIAKGSSMPDISLAQ